MTRRALLAALASLTWVLRASPARAMAFDKTQRLCATCHHWAGTRNVYAQTRVVVEVGSRGRCTNTESNYLNLWVGPLNSCPQYMRWDQLDSFDTEARPAVP